MNGFHHIRARVRSAQGLEPFPARGAWKHFFDYLMYGVGIFAPLALLPQIFQIYTTKSAAGVSLLTWFLFTFFNILWTIYGAIHKDNHIFFASAFMILFDLVVVIEILVY